MTMYGTYTSTSTYTVVDIRKTFEGFSADFRMIAARTEKMPLSLVEDITHDILKLAEAKYLDYVDITLVNQSTSKPVRAVRFKVDENGKAVQSDRAGSNDWQNINGTYLTVIASTNSAWRKLTAEQQTEFKAKNSFKRTWPATDIDNSYTHLSKSGAQLYGSNGYELKKENYK
jgi:hypothetical protein